MSSASRSSLRALLAAADSAAIEVAQALGAAAMEEVEPCLDHEDCYVRFLAMECLVRLGGGEVPLLLLERAEQEEEFENRLAAVHAMHQFLPIGEEHRVAQLFGVETDGGIRKSLALLLGRLGTPQAISHLAVQFTRLELAHDGLVASLAKHADPRAWARLRSMLSEARGERIGEVLELFDYAARPELMPALLPLLDRTEVAQDLSNHRERVVRRGVDLAVDSVLRFEAGAFAFVAREMGQYTSAEVSAVRNHLESRSRD